ncbi:MAG: hypothetical protein ACREQ4_02130, partial [Candidatus Binataceae bacterium]
MSVSALLEMVRSAAATHGLNLVAAIPRERYDHGVAPHMRAQAFAPRARSIIVIGNGGGAFWRHFIDHTKRHPEWLKHQHPLDDFTQRTVELEIAAPLRAHGSDCATVFPFMSGAASLNFMLLARLAGLAGPSIIGVTVHPRFGPWIAFRAALLIDEELDEPGIALG